MALNDPIIYSSYVSTKTSNYVKMMEVKRYFTATDNTQIRTDRVYLFFYVMFNANHCKKYGLKITDNQVVIYDYDYLDTTIDCFAELNQDTVNIYFSTSLTGGQLMIQHQFSPAIGFVIPHQVGRFIHNKSSFANIVTPVYRPLTVEYKAPTQEIIPFTYSENWQNYSSASYTYIVKEGNRVCITSSCKNLIDTPTFENGRVVATISDLSIMPKTIISAPVVVYGTKTVTNSNGTTTTYNTFRQEGIARLNTTTGEISIYGDFTTFRRIEFMFDYMIVRA